MTLSFFWKFLSIIDKWRGKAVDYDGVYGFQCVDFVKQYVYEQFNIRLGTFSGSALQWWKTGSPFNTKWERKVYTNWAVPEIGDIVFLNKTKNNPYGHVCIADNDCDRTHLRVIEQNAWNGNGSWKGSNAVTQRTITYISPSRWDCLWWFHLK